MWKAGSTLTQEHPADAQKATEKFLTTLGVKHGDIASLQSMPAAKLMAAMTGVRLGPVVDGRSLPRDPFDPDAPPISADIPMLIGTTETEGSFFAPTELLTLDDAAVKTRLQRSLGEDTDRIIALFRKNRPKATPSEIYFTILGVPNQCHDAGAAEVRPASRPGLPLLLHLADADPEQAAFISAHHRNTVRVQQSVAAAGTGRHRGGLAAAGRQK